MPSKSKKSSQAAPRFVPRHPGFRGPGSPGFGPGGGPGGPAVHGEMVVPNKAGNGFVTITSDGGTIKSISGFDLDAGWIARLYNPVAAFPSIHMAFAVVSAAGVRALSRDPAVRAAAAVYPPAVAFTIFGTGNHYVLDAAAGCALGAAAVRVSSLLDR